MKTLMNIYMKIMERKTRLFFALFFVIGFSAQAIGEEIYNYDTDADLAALDSKEEAAMDSQDVSKERILLDLFSSYVANLETQLESVKQCASLDQSKTCADHNSLCETVLGLLSSAANTMNVIQAYASQSSGNQSRGIASQVGLKFSADEESKYNSMKSKARRLKLETNQFCLSAR